MKNQIHASITVVIFLLILAWFAFFQTSTEDDIQKQTFVFPTPTPTAALGGNGWWNEIPERIFVEPMPTSDP